MPGRRTARLAVVATSFLAVPLLFASIAPRDAGAAPPPGVERTPSMGWNTWNTFGCQINENVIQQTADALVSSGMRDAGYKYVIVDDCWFNPQRDAQGNLEGSPDRFPSGMKALADYVHGKGLKFGIYEVPAATTCAQRGGAYPGATGSLGHEEQDARTFASWGVDYLKYDWCSPDGTLDDQIAGFTKMRDALLATGRPIVYSINANSYHYPKNGATYDWGTIANQWRTTEDIKGAWDLQHVNDYPMGVINIVDIDAPLYRQAGPGHFNDADMLEVGVYNVEGHPGLSDTEARAHFGLWALMSSPLIAGNDVRNMTDTNRKILTNRDVLAIDQDPLGKQAVPVGTFGDIEVFVKQLVGGWAIGLLNRSDHDVSVGSKLGDFGLHASASDDVRDAFTGVALSADAPLAAGIPAHGLVLLRVGR